MKPNFERYRVLANPIYDDPTIPCLKCNSPLVSSETLEREQTAESLSLQSETSWEPSWIDENFHARLRCNQCSWTVWATGKVLYRDSSYPTEKEQIFGVYFEIRYIHPYIELFEIPENVSGELREALLQAFEIIWLNPDAAANRIRVSVDMLLSDMKIAKTRLTKARKRVRLTTHERIKMFSSTNSKAASYLEAAKWIGNDGSHETGLTKSDVLDGLQLVHEALKQVYPEPTKYVDALAKRINKQKTSKNKTAPILDTTP